MYCHQSSSGWVVHAPAKLNLFFEVLTKRSDGYHEIETLIYPISLYDTLCFRDDPAGLIELGCTKVSGIWGARGSALGELPPEDDNLVVRAIKLLRHRAGIGRGASVRLVKRIPSAAGLGGGSSDAAAALAAANVAWKLDWPASRLARLGAELGSDVPAFFAGGPAICRGRGERVEPVASSGMLHLVVVRPPAGLSTAAVYRACRPPRQARSVGPLVDALARGNLFEAGRLLFNRLESAAEELSPWVRRLRRELSDLDCLGYQMSGSGTCCFGLCRHARHARRVARRVGARGIGVAATVQGSR